MRYKVVPPVRDVALCREVAAALPLVPGTVEDCCTRIRDRTAVPSRDAAREWLTFCQALGLAAETDRGFHRVREEPDDDALADAFRENVFGAREVLAAAADGPTGAGTTVDEAFAALRERVPGWERAREEDWKAAWRERCRRLLAWGVVFGYVERDGDVYYRHQG